jgi:NTP pyrophosphatase (non-canonical NTP hydrolase)
MEQQKVDISDLVNRAYRNAAYKGFWECIDPHDVKIKLMKLALITSEVGEAIEAVRSGYDMDLAEELADICIRVFDLAGALGFDLEQAILDKMDKNSQREYMHGKLA